MTRGEREDLALAAFLLALAGFVDAVGFLVLGGLFVSFMSGNSTQLAIKAGHGIWVGAATAGAMIGLFVAGVVVGRLIAAGAGALGRPAILALEAVCLGLAAILPIPALGGGGLMALAMGAQNGNLLKAGAIQTGLTYVTGTLVHFGEKLADALIGAGPIAAVWPYLMLWAALVAGGAAGAVAYARFGLLALMLPAVAAGLLAAASALPRRR